MPRARIGEPFHRAGGVHGFGGLRFAALLGRFCLQAVKLMLGAMLEALSSLSSARV